MIEYYGFTVDMNTTVAAGATAQFTTKIDTAGVFIAQALGGAIWTPATVLTTTLARTQYAPDSTNSPVATTGNSMPTLNFFRVQIAINAVTLFSNPISALLLFGPNGGSPHYFQTQPLIRPTSDIVVTLYNDCASTFGVQGQLLFEGYKATDNDAARLLQGRGLNAA